MGHYLNLVDIKNLYFKYDNTYVLKNLNLEVKKKDFLAIIGPNGGGKSTLIKLILGFLTPTKGIVKVNSTNIGYVPQNTNINLNFPITALEVVMLGHKNNKNNFFKKIGFWYDKEEISCAKNSLKLVGVSEVANNKINELSGGQRQRVMIARALCNHPDLLILDEPTANIDAIGQKEVFELLKELNKTITIIIVSHDIQILNYAKNAAFINKELIYHNLDNIVKLDKDGHFCEVEMLQMLSSGNKC